MFFIIIYIFYLLIGGTEVCIWDILAGGKLIARFLPHHKTITCMAMASGGKKILTGSIDKKVKVIDVQNYDVVHTITYDSPVVSLGISVCFVYIVF